MESLGPRLPALYYDCSEHKCHSVSISHSAQSLLFQVKFSLSRTGHHIHWYYKALSTGKFQGVGKILARWGMGGKLSLCRFSSADVGTRLVILD